MVRACCENMGLKKGPWTPEEDQILISFIQRYGHQNWRALPKQAGLLRCGKSCRLRWINYLRPDIKRGNFTKEEEEAISKLHHMLGNRWSAIATRLPGRTDNEIKNFWNTHLKKREKLLLHPTPQNMLRWSPLWSPNDTGICESSRAANNMDANFRLEFCHATAAERYIRGGTNNIVEKANAAANTYTGSGDDNMVRSYTLKTDSLDSDLHAPLYSPIGGQYKTLTIPALVRHITDHITI